ncbi:hypothetical protein REPUB_Repub01dG0039800 [Reevesia pubescens]
MLNPMQAEVEAILWGMEIAVEQGVRDIIVDSDCLLAIKEIAKGTLFSWMGGNLILNILSLEFNSCSFSHVKRDCNKLAHDLANYPGQVGVRNFFWRDLPAQLCNPDLIQS